MAGEWCVIFLQIHTGQCCMVPGSVLSAGACKLRQRPLWSWKYTSDLCMQALQWGRIWELPSSHGDSPIDHTLLAVSSHQAWSASTCVGNSQEGTVFLPNAWETETGKNNQSNLRGSREWVILHTLPHSPCPTSYSSIHRLSYVSSQESNHSSQVEVPILFSAAQPEFCSHQPKFANLCLSHSQIYTVILILRVVSSLAGEEERPSRHGEINM